METIAIISTFQNDESFCGSRPTIYTCFLIQLYTACPTVRLSNMCYSLGLNEHVIEITYMYFTTLCRTQLCIESTISEATTCVVTTTEMS